MKKYSSKVNYFPFFSPSTNALWLSILVFALSLTPLLLTHSLKNVALFSPLNPILEKLAITLLLLAVILLVLSITLKIFTPPTVYIVRMVRRGLFDPAHGNPLHLRDGELLPKIRCKRVGNGLYDLTISAQQSVTIDAIKAASPSISAALNHRFHRYAVVSVDQDVAFNGVYFRLDDVKVDRSLAFQTIESMAPTSPVLLRVDKATNIDLTTSGSMLVAGKTRSGKTTGIISLLLQVLLTGRDQYGSEVMVIDPKRAELSMLPHVVTLDEDGEAGEVLATLKQFEAAMVSRQKVLNDLSKQRGDAVKWWDAGMHPSFVFLDEYVACRSIFPKKSAKDSDYCLDTFDSLVKRIVTMGASAGCYVIISIAEASVESGGLPAMLRSAMSTRILFRPTMQEGKLIWDTEKLSNLPSRVYRPGDAWFSSTDGINDTVSYVRFPHMEFAVYQELGMLLRKYYEAQ